MIIAILFNADDPKYHGSYGAPIERAVFGCGLIIASNQHMKVSIGDVTIFSRSGSKEKYDALTEAAYFNSEWSLLHENRLRATFHVGTVYALVFENMRKELAEELHSLLTADAAYLGAISVDYAFGPHLVLFRNSLIERYRLQGDVCNIFERMSEADERSEYERIEMHECGYAHVDWEDRGAHKTIFDDFDTVEHFEQVKVFREAIIPFLDGGEDAAYELAMILEDLNARLFNVLGAASASLLKAKNEEHIAQAALSGRRYMEKLADALFAPRADAHNGRSVTKERYINRLCAYVFDHADNSTAEEICNSLSVNYKIFNSGLHSDKDRARIMKAFAETSALTARILLLDATAARKPYQAHHEAVMNFFREVAGIDPDDDLQTSD